MKFRSSYTAEVFRVWEQPPEGSLTGVIAHARIPDYKGFVFEISYPIGKKVEVGHTIEIPADKVHEALRKTQT